MVSLIMSISGNLCEIIVDDGERRLGHLIALLSQSGAQIKKVTLGQTDLEDVFIEFAKGTDSDMGVRDLRIGSSRSAISSVSLRSRSGRWSVSSL